MDGELDDSLIMALEALRDRLRRDADREARQALQLEVLGMAGYTAAEARKRLGLSDEETRFAVRRLSRSLAQLRADIAAGEL